jgi:alpha-pyrone synthase
LATSINRTAINFMGCYGAFNAIKVADAICKSTPEAIVLVVCVELCSLHFLKNKDEDHILSSTLFGDGAAALLLSSIPLKEQTLSLESFYCDILREGKDDMAWHISDFGFEMKLSSYVPDLIKGGIRVLTENLLKFLQLNLSDVDYYAIHPGGKRILQIIETELGFSKEKNRHAYEVLRNYGNMSSPTVLFVLELVFQSLTSEDAGNNILSFAFGPGLTLEGMLLKVNQK